MWYEDRREELLASGRWEGFLSTIRPEGGVAFVGSGGPHIITQCLDREWLLLLCH